MYNRFVPESIKKIRCFLFLWLLVFPLTIHASFIETTIGTAIVNDATAAYYNPAALVLLKNPQIIPLGTVVYFRSRFSGQSTRLATGITETGSSSSHSHYYSPSLYLGTPVTDRITVGFAIIMNYANRNADEHAVLRYVQANNNVKDYDLIPAIAVKINEFFSLGAGINFSYLDLHLQPITGFPGSNIPDSESSNQSDGNGVGANAGFLLKPGSATIIGFNYRSITTYRLSGKSTFEGNPQIVSNNYHFKVQTPARSVFSISHFVTPNVGFITTIQRIQWSIIRNINVYNIATQVGSQPVILNAVDPYYLHDTWVLTFGSHYRVSPKWIVRVAGTYNQSPGNNHYQIVHGDSFILGASMGYEINKYLTIDGSYSHAFIKNENIDIIGKRFLINGVNEGARDAVSLKLIFNLG